MVTYFELLPVSHWWGLVNNFLWEAPMRHWMLVLFLAIVGALIFAGCKKDEPLPAEPVVVQPEVVKTPEPTKPDLPSELITANYMSMGLNIEKTTLPTLEELKTWNAEFKDVPVELDTSTFSEKDMNLLRHFVAAAEALDEIFWMQNSADGLKYRDMCRNATSGHSRTTDTEGMPVTVPYMLSEYDAQLCQFIELNYGRFNRKLGNKAFITDKDEETRALGATFYDPNIRKDELERAVAEMDPQLKAQFESAYTTVWIDEVGSTTPKLKATSYSEEYPRLLLVASHRLSLAASYADSESQKKFLMAQAQAFLDNDYAKSDTAWVLAGDSKFMLLASFYEVYDDMLKGWKAAAEAAVGIVDQAMTDKIMLVQKHLANLALQLPIDKKYLNKRPDNTPIVAMNVLGAWGQAGASVQMSACKLPNDAKVTDKVGSKIFMNLNFQHAKFAIGLKPIGALTLAGDLAKTDLWLAYFWHNFTHEASHSMGPGVIKLADGTTTTVDKALGEYGSIIEEAKGDVGGYWLVPRLVKLGALPENLTVETALSSLPGYYRMVRFGIHEAHARCATLVYNYFMERSVYAQGPDGRYTVDVAKFYEANEELFKELLLIEGTGDPAAAKLFIDTYGTIRPEVEGVLATLSELPVDIRPIYLTARKEFGAKK
ncbi:MAG: MutT/NUDIX family protein [Parcubacteria group bacterium GW2011_GWA2_40_23]|nr:MAG: MutT/NUDIX family protein [Parcubacteria group bacterium GW2011_GWA2_40_23]